MTPTAAVSSPGRWTAPLCYLLSAKKIGTAAAAHIHRGAVGVAGPVRVELTAPNHASVGCKTISSALATALRDHPRRFYVNVHTAGSPTAPSAPSSFSRSVTAGRSPSPTRLASAGGRRRAGVPGALGGRRRPPRRRHGAPAADPADDADRLRRFYGRLSDETIYYRFFSLYRSISDRDVERFTVVDHHDRAALIATIGDEMIGVVRYERIDAESRPRSRSTSRTRTRAAASARCSSSTSRQPPASAASRGSSPTCCRRTARCCASSPTRATSSTRRSTTASSALSFDLEPTEDSLAVTYAREHRAEARSRSSCCCSRGSVAVVGAGRDRAARSATSCCATCSTAGFAGPVHVGEPTGRRGRPASRRTRRVPRRARARSTWPSSPCPPTRSRRSSPTAPPRACAGWS